jgi:hypothetical protein
MDVASQSTLFIGIVVLLFCHFPKMLVSGHAGTRDGDRIA